VDRSSNLDVLSDRERAEQLEALEGAGDALASGNPVMGTPSKTTSPPVGRWRPVMTLNSVVLPAPFGPISPVM
jgi:hypothetical protein